MFCWWRTILSTKRYEIGIILKKLTLFYECVIIPLGSVVSPTSRNPVDRRAGIDIARRSHHAPACSARARRSESLIGKRLANRALEAALDGAVRCARTRSLPSRTAHPDDRGQADQQHGGNSDDQSDLLVVVVVRGRALGHGVRGGFVAGVVRGQGEFNGLLVGVGNRARHVPFA
jgi:hypothetical protein